ncbi:uncharacterized protein SOCE26_001620 [Sorangium cellulosum]|uniref:Uncharacterized protein n=1 Tax=Sorangium cellulosum TaxID=56 RepID=A0A2L0EHK4_SORCE|nr:uncharacterized protein SOCE26_001620 [Sorangium cellulosum]
MVDREPDIAERGPLARGSLLQQRHADHDLPGGEQAPGELGRLRCSSRSRASTGPWGGRRLLLANAVRVREDHPRRRQALLLARACSSPRCWIEAEQPADGLVNHPGRLAIPEGDGAAQDAGERGNHGDPGGGIDRRELTEPHARRLGRGWVHAVRGGSIRRHAPLKLRGKRRFATVRPRTGILAGFLTR